jgi:hypothetical protein
MALKKKKTVYNFSQENRKKKLNCGTMIYAQKKQQKIRIKLLFYKRRLENRSDFRRTLFSPHKK